MPQLSKFRKKHLWFLALVGLFILTSFLVLGRPEAHAAGSIYHVAPRGSDTNTGTLQRPFKTIQKCASVAVAGDTCAIHEGTYHETVTPAHSGTADMPITFRLFLNERVIVDGADPVGSWSLYQGKIYQADLTANASLFANQLFVDGTMLNEARWPNSGLDQLHPARSEAEYGSAPPILRDSHLTQANNFWVGATVHIWGHDAYGSQTGTVTASNQGRLRFSGANRACPYLCLNEGAKYYLSGVLNALDSPGEWFYDSTAHKLYLWMPQGDNPDRHQIEIKQRNYAFDLSGKSFITVQSLALFASTVTTDQNSSHNIIDKISASYLSHFTFIDNPDNSEFGFLSSHVSDTGIILSGTYNTLSNSVLNTSAGNGVALSGAHNIITNNIIHDTDYAGTYAATVYLGGSDQQVLHNTLYRTGRDAITGGGDRFANNRIAYNDIFSTSVLNRDSGSIYICCETDSTGSSIDHNYIHDSQVNIFQGFDFNSAAIYPDNGTHDLQIHHNVVWNSVSEDYHVNGDNQGQRSQNNLIYNNTFGPGQSNSVGCCPVHPDGTQLVNNIILGDAPTSITNGTVSNNLTSEINPEFMDADNFDFRLRPNSPAINAGTVLPPYTDGYKGSAPDIGAYEYGAAPWRAGSSLFGADALPSPPIKENTTLSGQMTLSWEKVKNATGYTLYYGTQSGNYSHVLRVGNALTHTFAATDLLPGACYYFAVRASNGRQTSALSTEVTHYTPGYSHQAGQLIQAGTYTSATPGISDTALGIYMGNSGNSDTVGYDGVDFGDGANQFTVDLANDDHFANQPFEIHLDSANGPLIAAINLQGTGNDYYLSWHNYIRQAYPITPTSGIHKVFFVSKAVAGTTNGFIRNFSFTTKLPDTSTKLLDPFDDWSKVYAHSDGWRFDNFADTWDDQDPSILSQEDGVTTPTTVTYHLSNIQGFTGVLYQHLSFYADVSTTVTVSISADGTTWQDIDATFSSPQATSGGWARGVFTPVEDEIPAGTQYLRLSLNVLNPTWAVRLSQIELSYNP